VPDVVGRGLDDARSILDEAGWKTTTRTVDNRLLAVTRRGRAVGSGRAGHVGRRDGMGGRMYRVLRTAVAGCLFAFLVGCTTPAGAPVAGPAPIRTGGVPAPPVRLLQLNLCGSGIAACYTGRSVAEAAAVLRAEAPDLVTLNEVCQDDVSTLQRALADVVPGGAATSAFQAARNRRTGDAYRCRNGQQYGIGVVSRWPPVSGTTAGRGIYPAQDEDDPEERAWLCLDVAAGPAVAVCTTHLADTKREVAGAQCEYLFGTVIASMRTSEGAVPLVVGGDLNLGPGDGPQLRSCLPAGSALVDDGGVQHVVGTSGFVVDGSRTIDLRGSTDHPGLLVTLARR
jgi:endonuclease/exonuclease/phosphatase family metal-dependent hydrolase